MSIEKAVLLSGDLAFGVLDASRLDDPEDLARRLLQGGGLESSFGLSGFRFGTESFAAVGSRAADSNRPFPSAKPDDLLVAGVVRLYDKSQLARLLGMPSSALAGLKDIEWIALAYRRWGIHCLDYLVGDFALLIDDRSAGRRYLIRDHIGTIPLYHGSLRGGLVWSTDMASLLGAGLTEVRLNPHWLAMYQCGFFLGCEQTAVDGLYALPPATYLECSAGKPKTVEYWRPSLTRVSDGSSAQDWSTGLLNILRTSVRDRMDPSAVMGAQLSGGLDSSAILALLGEASSEIGNDRLPPMAFSLVFPDVPESDESVWIRKVLEHLSRSGKEIKWEPVVGSELDPLAYLKPLVKAIGQPVLAPNMYLQYELIKRARASEIDILFTGHDGDSVVSHGWARLTELALAGQWQELETELDLVAASLSSYKNARQRLARSLVFEPLAQHLSGLGKAFHAYDFYRAGRVSGRSRLVAMKGLAATLLGPLLSGSKSKKRLCALAAPDFEARLQSVFVEITATSKKSSRNLGEDYLRAMRNPLKSLSFEYFYPVGLRFQVTLAHPFFDRRVVEYCAAVPSEEVLRQGWTRRYLREAIDGLVPGDVAWRRDKSNLSANLSEAVRHRSGGIRHRLNTFYPGLDLFFDSEKLHSMADGVDAGEDSAAAVGLMTGLSVSAWCETVGPRL